MPPHFVSFLLLFLLELTKGFEKYSIESSKHEAGYDSLLTGLVFITIGDVLHNGVATIKPTKKKEEKNLKKESDSGTLADSGEADELDHIRETEGKSFADSSIANPKDGDSNNSSAGQEQENFLSDHRKLLNELSGSLVPKSFYNMIPAKLADMAINLSEDGEDIEPDRSATYRVVLNPGCSKEKRFSDQITISAYFFQAGIGSVRVYTENIVNSKRAFLWIKLLDTENVEKFERIFLADEGEKREKSNDPVLYCIPYSSLGRNKT